MFTDREVIGLYEEWSDECYAAQFMDPSPGLVRQFREWLSEKAVKVHAPLEGFELAMVIEYRRQEVDGGG